MSDNDWTVNHYTPEGTLIGEGIRAAVTGDESRRATIVRGPRRLFATTMVGDRIEPVWRGKRTTRLRIVAVERDADDAVLTLRSLDDTGPLPPPDAGLCARVAAGGYHNSGPAREYTPAASDPVDAIGAACARLLDLAREASARALAGAATASDFVAPASCACGHERAIHGPLTGNCCVADCACAAFAAPVVRGPARVDMGGVSYVYNVSGTATRESAEAAIAAGLASAKARGITPPWERRTQGDPAGTRYDYDANAPHEPTAYDEREHPADAACRVAGWATGTVAPQEPAPVVVSIGAERWLFDAVAELWPRRDHPAGARALDVVFALAVFNGTPLERPTREEVPPRKGDPQHAARYVTGAVAEIARASVAHLDAAFPLLGEALAAIRELAGR